MNFLLLLPSVILRLCIWSKGCLVSDFLYSRELTVWFRGDTSQEIECLSLSDLELLVLPTSSSQVTCPSFKYSLKIFHSTPTPVILPIPKCKIKEWIYKILHLCFIQYKTELETSCICVTHDWLGNLNALVCI